jgi:hypothetical protein
VQGSIETIYANQRTIPMEPTSRNGMTEPRATSTNVGADKAIALSTAHAAGSRKDTVITQSQMISLPSTPHSKQSKSTDQSQ